jgi:predicted enzyme related to lactoylglutathione lyase
MGERTAHKPGTVSWADLSTTDQEGAKAFYSGLFGWEADDLPVGDGAVYSMMRLSGRAVGAISTQQQAQRDAGVPPAWNTYVTVADADASAARAGELGANVHAPPFDVMEAGRMAVLQDPQGAFVMLWQAGASIGAELVNEPGAMVWNELVSPDVDGSTAFYSGLFGWDIAPMEGSPMPYLAIKNGETSNGGIRGPQEGEPPYWLVYFATDDLDAALARVQELGGTSLSGAMDMGPMRLAMVQDPQGAVFALYQGPLEP